jgi:hypothetical protein
MANTTPTANPQIMNIRQAASYLALVLAEVSTARGLDEAHGWPAAAELERLTQTLSDAKLLLMAADSKTVAVTKGGR